MKVILNLSTNITGGAGIAALRYHNFFLKSGYKSLLVTKDFFYIDKKTQETRQYSTKIIFFNLFKKLIKKIDILQKLLLKLNKYCFYSIKDKTCLNVLALLKKYKIKKIDHIFIHWTDGLINFKAILELKKQLNCKVTFMMYDMHHITGGCHYSYECNQYRNGCQGCPAVPFFYKKKIKENFNSKLFFLNQINADICVFSYQDFLKCKSSKLKYKKIHRLYIPIDIKKKFKKVKNSRKTILTSVLKFDPRKGYNFFVKYLVELNKALNKKKEQVIFLYQDNSDIFSRKFSNIKFKKIEKYDEGQLHKIYENCDLFINFSIADSAPMMINEALMFGIPVLSTDKGHARDLIVNGSNGYIIGLNDLLTFVSLTLKIIFEKKFLKLNQRQISLDYNFKCNIKKLEKKIKKII